MNRYTIMKLLAAALVGFSFLTAWLSTDSSGYTTDHSMMTASIAAMWFAAVLFIVAVIFGDAYTLEPPFVQEFTIMRYETQAMADIRAYLTALGHTDKEVDTLIKGLTALEKAGFTLTGPEQIAHTIVYDHVSDQPRNDHRCSSLTALDFIDRNTRGHKATFPC